MPESSRNDWRARAITPEGWTLPPDRLDLANGEVHLWTSGLDVSEELCEELKRDLSPDEIQRAHALRFKRFQERFIVGRALLRRTLARYVDTDPTKLTFAYTANGKPHLVQPNQGASLQFNLAHSNGLIVLAVTRNVLVGIDVEQVRAVPDAERIAALFFSRREFSQLSALPQSERDVAFFNAWTRKEACLKAIGIGLDESISEIEVTLTPGEPARILGLPSGGNDLPRWSLTSFRPAPGYIAALAALMPQLENVEAGDRAAGEVRAYDRKRREVSRRFCWSTWIPVGRKG